MWEGRQSNCPEGPSSDSRHVWSSERGQGQGWKGHHFPSLKHTLFRNQQRVLESGGSERQGCGCYGVNRERERETEHRGVKGPQFQVSEKQFHLWSIVGLWGLSRVFMGQGDSSVDKMLTLASEMNPEPMHMLDGHVSHPVILTLDDGDRGTLE